MNRVSIIQSLIDKHGYQTYAEIGVRDGSCFNSINVGYKVGVDPDKTSAATTFITSDEFFASNDRKFGIIFLDGLHESSQVTKDIENSLACLEEGGTIVMHDNLPTSEFIQIVPQQPDHNEWTGDVWRSFVKVRQEREDIEAFVVDTDWGVGILRKGKSEKLVIPDGVEINYANFVLNKEVWMNVRCVEWFKEFYLKR